MRVSNVGWVQDIFCRDLGKSLTSLKYSAHKVLDLYCLIHLKVGVAGFPVEFGDNLVDHGGGKSIYKQA